MSCLKALAVTTGIISGIGAGIGFAAEKSEDSVARGRIVTVDECLGSTAYKLTISEELLDCLEQGVPGGSKPGPGLHEGDPITEVTSFRKQQQHEAHFDFGKVVLGAVIAPPITVAAGIVIGPVAAAGAAGDYG